jgi:dipeptidyl aminopeptidase/acylaminoacyl peptidase
MSRPSIGGVAVVAALASIGCRGDVTPPGSAGAGVPASVGRLTTSDGEDRSPAWSPTGDSVYYSAEGFGDLPPAPGVLVGLPRDGGPALEMLKNVQLPNEAGVFPWFVAPALSPEGDRVAFVQIAPLQSIDDFCFAALASLSCVPEREGSDLPPLREVIVRVRARDATGPLEEDPALSVAMPGATRVEGPNEYGAPVLHIVRDYPFQQLFDEDRAFIFRASWAPGGGRLVLSDGLRLLVWSVGDGQAEAVPGSEDGIEPAWSPDGEWIAFSRIERADSSNAVCIYSPFGAQCVQERTDYVPGRRILSLIRPDGSDLRELGEGDEPAWSPDGATVFFRHADQIWSVPARGGAAVPVPGTTGGREPAVSPDGRFLAFARRGNDGDHDIWVTALQR